MSLNLAYLAQGKLHLKLGSEPVRTIESRFAQTVRDRALRIQQQHAWKGEGRGARRSGEDNPALVPKSWELIRKTADGTEHIVARGVLSFDLCHDGSLVHTNGSAIDRVDARGTTERLVTDQLIEQVVALD